MATQSPVSGKAIIIGLSCFYLSAHSYFVYRWNKSEGKEKLQLQLNLCNPSLFCKLTLWKLWFLLFFFLPPVLSLIIATQSESGNAPLNTAAWFCPTAPAPLSLFGPAPPLGMSSKISVTTSASTSQPSTSSWWEGRRWGRRMLPTNYWQMPGTSAANRSGSRALLQAPLEWVDLVLCLL